MNTHSNSIESNERRRTLSSVARLYVRTLVCVLIFSTLAYSLAPWVIPRLGFGQHIAVSNLAPELEHAYLGKLSDPNLSDHETPSSALLYLVETRRGGFIHRLEPVFGSTYVFGWLKSLYEAHYPTDTYDLRIPLGPGHALHEDIRKKGDGRYSIWQGHVYFSLPDNGPLSNVKRIEVIVPKFPALSAPETVSVVLMVLGILALVAAAGLMFYGVFLALRPLYQWSAAVRSVTPGLVISFGLLWIIVGGGELYLRANGMFPKDRNTWPGRFIPGVGFLFQPGGEVRWTNGMDFWTVQRANSLGFLDWEPAIPKPPGTFRIAIVGDSFIEAAQITKEFKVQTLLAQALNKDFPQRKFDVIALGYSGTGQSNQLSFFEYYKDRLQPDLVILVFVGNDFANNSPLLEAARQGSDPEHPPVLFLRRNPDGSCGRIPIAADWMSRLIPGGTEVERVRRLKEMSPEYKAKLEGWNPEKESLDFLFYETRPLPPAFEEAVELTKCAFAAWKQRAEQGGFSLFVTAAEHVTAYGTSKENNSYGQINRLRKILAELQIPLLDLYQMNSLRGDINDARWKFDGHWTPTGHRWAAQSIFEFLKDKGYLKPQTAASSNH